MEIVSYIITCMWFLSRMNYLVFLQPIGLCKLFLAYITCMWSISRMNGMSWFLETDGMWPDMVYLPHRGNVVDHDFLEALCLASFLQHVNPLAMEALPSNSP